MRHLLAVVTTVILLACSSLATGFKTLHDFAAQPAQDPSSLVQGPDGNLYGTTVNEGTACPTLCGTVFELALTSGRWQYQVIHSFVGSGSDGEAPLGPLLFDQAGNIYGTTFSLGNSQTCLTQHLDCGTVFELSPSSAGWVETILYKFTGSSDGAYPGGNIVLDGAGNLYGTTYDGGTSGWGVVYELTPGADGWSETVLYSFTGANDGGVPEGGVTFDGNGNLLGTTYIGGSSGVGTVFKLTPSGSGWTQSVLYSFTGGSDGAYPGHNLLLDSAGNIYGAAAGGGLTNCTSGCGTVFELSPSGAGWTFSDLYSFSGPDGQTPGEILFDASGNIFGVADGGVLSCPCCGCGVLYKLVPGSSQWTQTELFKFNGTTGEFPDALVLDRTGDLYGTTSGGGTHNDGTVFGVRP